MVSKSQSQLRLTGEITGMKLANKEGGQWLDVLKDSWIREYLRYTENTESPSMFHYGLESLQ